MNKRKIKGDGAVDALYAGLRGRYGGQNPQANGYRYYGYFLTEQKNLLSLLNPDAKIVIDVGCGSGLMIQPVKRPDNIVIGVDFNRDACRAAKHNGLNVIQGDAFGLPFKANSIDEIVTCQFFNQQSARAVAEFIAEAAYALCPGGRLIMIWRNGEAIIHRLALAGLSLIDKAISRPCFPHENHPIHSVIAYGKNCGLALEKTQVTFPSIKWRSENTGGVLARLIGASAICVLSKPLDPVD